MSHQMNQALASSHITARSSDGKGGGRVYDATFQTCYHNKSKACSGPEKSILKAVLEVDTFSPPSCYHCNLLFLVLTLNARELGPAVLVQLFKTFWEKFTSGYNLCFSRIIYQSLRSFPGSAWSVTFEGTHVEHPTLSL